MSTPKTTFNINNINVKDQQDIKNNIVIGASNIHLRPMTFDLSTQNVKDQEIKVKPNPIVASFNSKPIYSIINTDSIKTNLLEKTGNTLADFYLGHSTLDGIGSIKTLFNDLLQEKSTINNNLFLSLFPQHNACPSASSSTPFADQETRLLFRQNPVIRKAQEIITKNMLIRFGINIDEQKNVTALNSDNLANLAWVKLSTAKDLREANKLQEIIKSLYLLENRELAVNILKFLLSTYRQYRPQLNLFSLITMLDKLPTISLNDFKKTDPIKRPKTTRDMSSSTKTSEISLEPKEESEDANIENIKIEPYIDKDQMTSSKSKIEKSSESQKSEQEKKASIIKEDPPLAKNINIDSKILATLTDEQKELLTRFNFSDYIIEQLGIKQKEQAKSSITETLEEKTPKKASTSKKSPIYQKNDSVQQSSTIENNDSFRDDMGSLLSRYSNSDYIKEQLAQNKAESLKKSSDQKQQPENKTPSINKKEHLEKNSPTQSTRPQKVINPTPSANTPNVEPISPKVTNKTTSLHKDNTKSIQTEELPLENTKQIILSKPEVIFNKFYAVYKNSKKNNDYLPMIKDYIYLDKEELRIRDFAFIKNTKEFKYLLSFSHKRVQKKDKQEMMKPCNNFITAYDNDMRIYNKNAINYQDLNLSNTEISNLHWHIKFSLVLNNALRYGEKLDNSSRQQDNSLQIAFNKAKNYQRNVLCYSGIANLDTANILANLKIGDTYTTPCYLSSSCLLNIAKKFCNKKSQIVLIINGRSGISLDGNKFLNEQEVLFSKNTSFTITNIFTKTQDEVTYRYMVLSEI